MSASPLFTGRRGFGVAAAALLAAWAGGASAAPAAPPAPPAAAPANAVPTYKLASGDKLRITVFDEPSLSGEFSISDAGDVDLPLIGAVHARGRTAPELQAAITAAFADGFLNSPKVTVESRSYRPFFILGEVNKPSDYPYSSGLTVREAVAMAGGFTYRANEKVVEIKHADGSAETKVRLEPTTPVAPGDTIRVRERYF